MRTRTKQYKTCKWCGQTKPRSAFYVHTSMADGRLNKCAKCVASGVRRHYRENHDARLDYERERNKTPARRRYLTEASRRTREANPEKYRARTAVSNAIRDGRLRRKPCEVCGAVKVQAHHEDYAKPLEVRWFCKAHHDGHHGTSIGPAA